MKKIIGIVIEGKKLGRKLGFPTANIELSEKMESGVYCGVAIVNSEKYVAAIFAWPDKQLLEAHLLDFNGDLYGKKIEIEINEKIRDSKKFNNVENLKKQISLDIDIIRKR